MSVKFLCNYKENTVLTVVERKKKPPKLNSDCKKLRLMKEKSYLFLVVSISLNLAYIIIYPRLQE